MAAFNKFNVFTRDLVNGVHNFGANAFKVLLTNIAPIVANAVKADLTELAAGNGYAAGGSVTAIAVSTAAGTAKATATDVIFTAAGGAIGPFRYAVLYNDTPAGDPLVGWYDYGSAITLADAETLTVDFDAAAGVLTVA